MVATSNAPTIANYGLWLSTARETTRVWWLLFFIDRNMPDWYNTIYRSISNNIHAGWWLWCQNWKEVFVLLLLCMFHTPGNYTPAMVYGRSRVIIFIILAIAIIYLQLLFPVSSLKVTKLVIMSSILRILIMNSNSGPGYEARSLHSECAYNFLYKFTVELIGYFLLLIVNWEEMKFERKHK